MPSPLENTRQSVLLLKDITDDTMIITMKFTPWMIMGYLLPILAGLLFINLVLSWYRFFTFPDEDTHFDHFIERLLAEKKDIESVSRLLARTAFTLGLIAASVLLWVAAYWFMLVYTAALAVMVVQQLGNGIANLTKALWAPKGSLERIHYWQAF